MNKIVKSLIPNLHQEFILVVFLLVPYVLLQFDFAKKDLMILSAVFMVFMVLWLVKAFFQENETSQYKGFVVLITGLSLFISGLYASLMYYFEIIAIIPDSIVPFLYLFFPIWIMLEGVLLLFLLGFDSSIQSVDLGKKIVIKKPLVGDFVMVSIATVLLIVLGELVLGLPWFINICLVFTVNLIMINQFSE